MSMMDLTADSLGKMTGFGVPEAYVIVAKNSVVGLTDEQIRDLLGATVQELREIQDDPIYQAIRPVVALEFSRESLDADFSWDKIEGAALQNLGKTVGSIRDTDQLLRIAAVANKAQRRHRTPDARPLDPAIAGGQRIALQLSERIVRRLQSDGSGVETTERRVSVTDGTATQPAFTEIDSLLGVKVGKAQLPSNFKIQTHEADFSIDDLTIPE